MARNNKFGYKSLKNAKVSLVALIILIVMIIFMVSPTVANAAAKDEVAIEFTKPAMQADTAEFHVEKDPDATEEIRIARLVTRETSDAGNVDVEVVLQSDSYTIPVSVKEFLTIDRAAELYTLEEVLYQVTMLDENAGYHIIKEDDKYIFEVAWSRGEDVYGHMEVLNVGEDLFICRGEDFRFMMMYAIMGVSMW